MRIVRGFLIAAAALLLTGCYTISPDARHWGQDKATVTPRPTTTTTALAKVMPTATKTSTPTARPTAKPSSTVAPVSTATRRPTAKPSPTTGLLVWVREDTVVVNVNKEPLETIAKEERWRGSVSRMEPSATSFTTREKYVEHGVTHYDVSLTVKFDTPPIVLNPGLRYKVSAKFTHDGTNSTTGAGVGEQFGYSPQKGFPNSIDPFVLKYYPWSTGFDGKATADWMISPPKPNRPGETYQIYAGLWNRAACNVTWTYVSQYH